jgi:hypothetical protein
MENKIKAADMGRSRKIKKLPSDRMSERLRAVSRSGPKTKASTRGAGSNWNFFMSNPTTLKIAAI